MLEDDDVPKQKQADVNKPCEDCGALRELNVRLQQEVSGALQQCATFFSLPSLWVFSDC